MIHGQFLFVLQVQNQNQIPYIATVGESEADAKEKLLTSKAEINAFGRFITQT